jgi:bifunctional aspartokinase / homoserine dehydrogenase 1
LRILKFGGSSLATPERVTAVCELIAAAAARGPVAVVVSAFGGVTDSLLAAAGAAARGEDDYRGALEALAERHRRAGVELAAEGERDALEERLERDLGDLGDLLHGARLVREASPRTRDAVASYGERLSAAVVAAALRAKGLAAVDCDARKFIVTGAEFGAARVDVEATYRRVREHFAAVAGTGDTAPLQVVTGFLGATPAGETTTLGRGGSDYTAALLGAALAVEAVELWTDVDGVMSADPRLVPAAYPIARLSYEELMELSHFGARVVYPPTVHPTRSAGVPLLIKNSFNPAAAGTRVDEPAAQGAARVTTDMGSAPAAARPLRGIASIHDVALLRLEGDGMVGVPGIAMRLFGALAREGISVILISQASSEHSICFAVEPAAVEAAVAALGHEFALEHNAGLIDDLVVERELAVIAAVGSAMREVPGIAGRLFGVLGENGINVRAVAQGSSERNISLVVARRDEGRALERIHEAFFFPERRTVEITLAGVGRVGGELLSQIAGRREALERERGLRLRLTALAGRAGAIADPAGLDPADAVARLRAAPAAGGLARLVDELTALRRPRRVFVDCTASEEVAAGYDRLLGAGIAVVTANKLRLAGPLAGFRSLRAAGPGRCYFETTVGAGLPVILSLEHLLETGDALLRIDGVLSGTLSYLMDRLDAGEPLSAAVARAHELGYTEPDPREDLGGRDVARKILILARVAGCPLEAGEVEVEPVLPADSPLWGAELDAAEFVRRLPEADAPFVSRRAAAVARGHRLRYVADGQARVGLQEVGPDHPCFDVAGTDNLIAIRSERYRESPLTVRGPGAGPAVTAAGVFADILRAVAETR